MENFTEIGQKTPQLVALTGGKGHGLKHFHEAGGVPAVLKALKGQWLPHPTVSGRGINDLTKAAQVKDSHVVKIRQPYRKEGGLVVLRGNLAAKGAVLQAPASLPKKLTQFSGRAKVFDSFEDAVRALVERKIVKGDVMVLRYEGPRGGQGFRPLALVPQMIVLQGLAESVAFLTDGRLGAPAGAGLFIEMISPEAADGSTLSVLREGDRIDVDLPARRLMAHLTDTELKVRLARWQAPAPRNRNGVLGRFAKTTPCVLEGTAR